MSNLIQKFPKFKSFLETPTNAKYDDFTKSNELVRIITLRLDEFHDLVDDVGCEYVIKREETQPKESEIIERLIDDIMILHCEMLQDPVEKVVELYQSFKVELVDELE